MLWEEDLFPLIKLVELDEDIPVFEKPSISGNSPYDLICSFSIFKLIFNWPPKEIFFGFMLTVIS